MINPTIKDIKYAYAKHGALWLPVNIWGIRHEENQELDVFNDVLGMTTDTETHAVNGTTDPGREATQKKSGGAAHLCLGFHYDIWAIDIHAANNQSFAHEAFCQRPSMGTKTCKIYRDLNRDGDFDPGEPVRDGYFGINMHRASIHGSKIIGAYSYGCQVHQIPESLAMFLDLAKRSGMKLFSYMLFDKKEFE